MWVCPGVSKHRKVAEGQRPVWEAFIQPSVSRVHSLSESWAEVRGLTENRVICFVPLSFQTATSHLQISAFEVLL